MTELKAGDSAPAFFLPDQDEKEVSLKVLRGKWVVLYFYPRDNTPGCTVEANEFTAVAEEFEKLGAVILGVSRDSAASHRKFICKENLKVRLLTDAYHSVMEDYGVWQLKTMYGKEAMGIIRSTFLIDPEGRISRSWYKVRVKGHVDEVKASLMERQKG